LSVAENSMKIEVDQIESELEVVAEIAKKV
jgi:hypothetical protein